MKKLFLFVLFLPLFVSAQSQIEICECADLFLSLEKEKRETKGHSYKIREKQNEVLKPCNDLYISLNESELKNFQSILEKCPAFHAYNQYYNESYKIEMDKEIAKNPNNVDAYFARGKAREYDDYKGKLADFTKVIELDPNFADAYLERADLNDSYNLPDYHNAIIDYTKYIEFDPQNGSVYYYRGYCIGSTS